MNQDQEINRKCGGVCCRRFYLPYGPEVFAEEYRKYLKGEPYRFEIGTLGPMLKYLGSTKNSWGGDSHYYTCNYLDTVSGLCLIYKHRPHMCWGYPYGGECQYDGCSDKPFYRRNRLLRPLYKLYKAAQGYYFRWKGKKSLEGALVQLAKKEENESAKPIPEGEGPSEAKEL